MKIIRIPTLGFQFTRHILRESLFYAENWNTTYAVVFLCDLNLRDLNSATPNKIYVCSLRYHYFDFFHFAKLIPAFLFNIFLSLAPQSLLPRLSFA